MTPERWIDELTLVEIARRLCRWARGRDYVTTRPVDIVLECGGASAWLHGEARDLLDADCLVVAPDAPVARANRRGERWVVARGSLTASGGELEIGGALRVHTCAYSTIGFAPIAGPTLFRVATVDDAGQYIDDVNAAKSGGNFRAELLHPLVELGDRCAVAASPCKASALNRLYVDADGVVRPSVGGGRLGTIGAAVDDLRARAIEIAGGGADPCVPTDVGDLLASVPRQDLAAYNAAIGALRAVAPLGQPEWRVAGFGWQLSLDSYSPRADVLILESSGQYLLFDSRTTRACRVSLGVARLVEDVLSGATEASDSVGREALSRLSSHGVNVAASAA
jgi:hypothetical protein